MALASPRIGISANVVDKSNNNNNKNSSGNDTDLTNSISQVALATAAATGLLGGGGPRSAKLHKRLQRRNRSLRPSYEYDGDIFHSVHSRIAGQNNNNNNNNTNNKEEEAEVLVSTTTTTKRLNLKASIIEETKVEGKPTANKDKGQERDEDSSSQSSSSKSPTPSPPPGTTVQELKSQLEILADSIKMQQERLNRPPNVDAYLPVASPRGTAADDDDDGVIQLSSSNNNNNMHYQEKKSGARHRDSRENAVDAEREYRTLFNAPSHVVVERTETFDTAEMSEITAPHGLNTKGASYTQRRLQGPNGMSKLQQQQRTPALLSRFNHNHQQGREPEETFRPDAKSSSGYISEVQEEEDEDGGEVVGGQEQITGLGASIDVNVQNLRFLGDAIEQAKQDLQRGVGTMTNVLNPQSPAVRHGLPYEKTDFRGDESSDDTTDDLWDKAIQKNNKSSPSKQQQRNSMNKTKSKRKSLDPDSGLKGVAEQGPPTPRTLSIPPPEKLQTLVTETVSPKGEVIVDTTEIRDEDIYGVNVLDTTGSREEPIEIDDDGEERANDDDGSELLGEDLIIASPSQKKGDGSSTKDKKKWWKQAKKLLPKNKKSGPSPKSNRKGSKSSEPPSAPQAESPSKAAQRYGYEAYFMQQQAAMLRRDENAQKEAQNCQDSEMLKSAIEENKKMASGFYKSSVDFIKSFSQQARDQLQKIQKKGLIDESDMDSMLGVLDKNLEETNREVPQQADDVVIFLGDEFEKSACGVNESVLNGQHTKAGDSSTHTSTHNKCPDAVESMLDSMKKAYHKSIEKCGLGNDIVKENAKAIEDMVTDLKTSYGNEVPSCVVDETCNNDAMMASIEQMKNTGLQEMNTIAALSFDTKQYFGGKDGTPEISATANNAPKEPSKLQSPVDADIFGSINVFDDVPNNTVKEESVEVAVEQPVEEVPEEEYPAEAGNALKNESSQAIEEFLQSAGNTESYSSKLAKYRAKRRPYLPPSSARSPTSLSSTGADVPSSAVDAPPTTNVNSSS
mmetsp:Transcript_26774/g.63840  ORF Transcript_26774/g.63840 Transcript_26774/m.63840 type:complete len:1017 (-) Transcript_26774:94-3144(-)